jgi:hypothetical protein
MNKKLLLLVLIVMAISVGTIPAQDYGGYIKPTFSMGVSTVEVENTLNSSSDSFTAVAFNVDFVNSFGLTFGLQDAMTWNDDVSAADLITFGLGYTFEAGALSVGAKLMAVPSYYKGGMGIDANATWWLGEYFGLTGIFDYFFNMGDVKWSLLSMRFGISALL